MDIFTVAAKIKLDTSEFTSGIESAAKKLKNFGSKIGSAVGTAVKVSSATLGAGAVAIAGIVKKSVSAYGQYQQLVGGMETLFKDSSDEIIGYAQEAYKTAGMSANEYMETATQFSAALLKSLDGDTEKAVQYTDKAIRQMSDNVNKMGTSVEMVQNAYRGFARSNFTMLDNLALGYAGTKAGMEELLLKAQELSAQQGEYREFSISSYADIVDAIGLVQDEIGITGTTAKEAAGTVTGSLASVKGAWENLLTGLGDPDADVKSLMTTLVTEAGVAASNIAPVVESALQGITTVISEQAPELISGAVGFINDMAPGLLEASTALFTSLVDEAQQGMRDLTEVIAGDNGELADLTGSAITYLTNEIPEFVDSGLDLFSALLNNENSPKILSNLATGITDLVSGIVGDASTGTGILGHIDDIRDGAFKLFSSMLDEGTIEKVVTSLSSSIGDMVVKFGLDMVNPFNIAKMFDVGVRFAGEIIAGVGHGLEHIVSEGIDYIANWMAGDSIEDEADFIDRMKNGGIWGTGVGGATGVLGFAVGDFDKSDYMNDPKRQEAAFKYAASQTGPEVFTSELSAEEIARAEALMMAGYDPNDPLSQSQIGRTPTQINIVAPNASAADVVDEIKSQLRGAASYR